MTVRRFVAFRFALAPLLASMGLAAVAPALPALEAEIPARPNFLWISTEDISPDLGCYGDAYAHTPIIDRLAGQGARFANAFSIAGVCAPTRSAIITGMYPTTIGTHHMRCKGVPPAYVKCFTEYLRAAGYYCANNSKTDYNFASPVTAWDESGRSAHWRGRAEGQPFFCVLNKTISHESKIRAADDEFARLTRRLKPDERHDPAKAVLPPYYPDTPVTRRDWARYADLITATDYVVGDVLAQLEEDGLAENTVVFFWGDHGRGLPRAKRWIYDSGLRVPLIVRWPGKIEAQSVRGDLVSFLDLAPTLLSLAGVKVPSHLQGRVFLGPNADPEPPYVFGARDRMDEAYDIIRCVRDRRYKYIRNFEPYRPYAQQIAYMDRMPTMREMRRLNAEGKLTGAQTLFFRPKKPVEELYDITTDPHEVRSLADDPAYRDVLERMRKAQEEWALQTGDLGLVPEAELQERVRPGGKWATTAAPTLAIDRRLSDGSAIVTIACPTPGASIAYTLDDGKPKRWSLYVDPVTVEEGKSLRAKACRLGFKDSQAIFADPAKSAQP